MTSAAESEILEIEAATRYAQLTGDTDFFERLLADDFQFITPQGKVVGKREDVDQYKSGQVKLNVVEVTERTVHCYGATAIVRFKVKFEGRAGKYDFSARYFFTRVYVKDAGRWQMVAGHSTDLGAAHAM